MKRPIQWLRACGLVAAGAFAVAALVQAQPAGQQVAICYNCPPEWADWASQIKAIRDKTGIIVPLDNKNSGQTTAQMLAEKSHPVADVAYLGIISVYQAKEKGPIANYEPERREDIPAGMKDPDGALFSIHSGTLGFFVNKDALEGKSMPRSWKDLLKPEYKGMVGYLDPSSAFIGYVGAVAVNQAPGGTLDDFSPAVEQFKQLKKNAPIVPKQTAYARAVAGEIPILLDYDSNAYRVKYKDHVNMEFVIPQEGTVAVPYVISLAVSAPHVDNAKEVLDFVLSDEGQALWANAYLRPVRASAMSKEAASCLLSVSEYARAETVDFNKVAAGRQAFGTRYLNEVR